VIAQNPDDYKTLPELTDDDRYWMEREHTRQCSRESERYSGTPKADPSRQVGSNEGALLPRHCLLDRLGYPRLG
jgi:hypothetical protein